VSLFLLVLLITILEGIASIDRKKIKFHNDTICGPYYDDDDD
jgi:hypothetical protein